MPDPYVDGPRIAVLPLANISPDGRDGFFDDGLTEELSSGPSRIAGIRVMARTSAMRYNRTKIGLAAIGRELGVSAILEGSVRRGGDRLRVTAHPIGCATEERLQSSDYDPNLADFSAMPSEVAGRIVCSPKGR